MTLITERVEQRLLHLVQVLPPERVAEVLDFAEFLYTREQPQANDVHAALQDSFGAWRDRTDLIGDKRRTGPCHARGVASTGGSSWPRVIT